MTSSWDRGNQSQSMPVSSGNRGEMLIDVHPRLITIFDCKIDMDWKGTTSDGTEVNGTVSVPEVSHEVTVDGLSDYMVSGNRLIEENRHSKVIK